MNRESLLQRLSALRPHWPVMGSVKLSAPLVLVAAAITAITIGWSFYMGFVIGRDQNPQNSVPAIGQLFGKDDGATPADSSPDAGPGAGAQTPEAAGIAEPAPPDDGAQARTEPAAITADAARAWPAAPAAQPAAGQKTPADMGGKPREKPSPLFDWRFQIAAFRTSAEAAALAGRIRIRGLKTAAVKSGKVYLVTGQGRMSESDAGAARLELAALGLGEPLLLSRTPVGRKRAASQAAAAKKAVPGGKTAAQTPGKAAGGAGAAHKKRPAGSPGKSATSDGKKQRREARVRP